MISLGKCGLCTYVVPSNLTVNWLLQIYILEKRLSVKHFQRCLQMSMIKTLFTWAGVTSPLPPFRSDQAVQDTTEDESKPDSLPLAQGKRGDTPPKQEKAIQENLARFARLPATTVFEFVHLFLRLV
jgi:hypothetical protein